MQKSLEFSYIFYKGVEKMKKFLLVLFLLGGLSAISASNESKSLEVKVTRPQVSYT